MFIFITDVGLEKELCQECTHIKVRFDQHFLVICRSFKVQRPLSNNIKNCLWSEMNTILSVHSFIKNFGWLSRWVSVDFAAKDYPNSLKTIKNIAELHATYKHQWTAPFLFLYTFYCGYWCKNLPINANIKKIHFIVIFVNHIYYPFRL